MKILVAGYGFVGKAQELVLKDKHDLKIYDPHLGHDYVKPWQDISAVIVCVSTPARNDGSCEMKNVYNVIEESPDIPILIKSTISVEGWQMLTETFPDKQICFSPEFLRQNSWKEDAFIKHMYVGGTNTNFWIEVFKDSLGVLEVTVQDPVTLVAAKAFRNSFLATKVAFFNQIFDYCRAYDLDFDSVRSAVAADERIGDSHTAVTEQRGFGGHCFPKDTSAITKSAQRVNTRLTLIEEAINYNRSIRKE